MFLLHRTMPHLSFSVIVLVSATVGLFFLGLVYGSDALFSILGRDHTLTGRTYIWELAWASFLDSPIFGYGYATYGGSIFNSRIESYYGDIAGPENAYFNVVLETGLIGAVALFVPVMICLVRAFRLREISAGQDRQAAECFILIALAALVMGITESTPLMITSYGGPINFTVLFCLATINLAVLRYRRQA
jgi:O-antigen ligase